MANEKILNTRLQLKYDTYENWYASTFILKAGEVAIATVANNEANINGTKFTNLPNIVIKVGDGVNLYKDLKFVSALAADVHDWAKSATPPTYDMIGGLEEYVRGLTHEEIQDTDTQYTIVPVEGSTYKFELRSKGLSDEGWSKAAEIDLTAVGERLTALEGLVGSEKVETQISNAIGALDVAKVEVAAGEIIDSIEEIDGIVTATKRALTKADIPAIDQSQVNGLTDKLAEMEGAASDAADDALEAAKKYADDADLAAAQAMLYNDEGYVAGQFVTKVTQENGIIEVERAEITMGNVKDLNTTIAGINEEVGKKQDKLYFTSTPDNADNKVATQSYVLEAVADLETAMQFVGRLDAVPATGEGYEAGSVILVPAEDDANVMIEYVLDKQGVWQQLGHESIYQLKSESKTQHEALQKAIEDGLKALDDEKQDNLTFVGDYSADNGVMTKAATDAAIDEAVKALDAAEVKVAAGEIIEAISEADGIVTVTKRALAKEDIPTIEQNQVNGLPKALEDAAKAGTDAAATAEQNAKDYADDEIAKAVDALDYTDNVVEKQVVVAVSESNGVIAPEKATLADIAWSGHVKDLKQDDYIIVFNCGTASTVI